MCKSFLLQACVIFLIKSLVICAQTPVMPKVDENLEKISFKEKPVAPCVACQKLVQSFLLAVTETTRQSFAGGDADWEKQKLGTYENSELRFIEIQEMLCSDVRAGKDQCYNLAEQYESELEEWFFEKRKKNVDLHEYLCITHLKVCCPNNTYGPNCIPCPGGIENTCSGHGKCLKGGTREAPASCSCDAGYGGDICNQCKEGYYQDVDTPTLSCKKCDRACKNHCRGPGPKNCEVCATGYHFLPDEGCIEYLEDHQSKVKTENISHDVNIDKASNEISQDDKELPVRSNIEDSSVNRQHPEL